MKNNALKDDILNGNTAIFKVLDEQEQFIRYEILGYDDILTLLTESNSERILDLSQLYYSQHIQFNDDEVYYLVCGNLLIARLLHDTAENIQDDIEFSIDLEKEKFNDFDME